MRITNSLRVGALMTLIPMQFPAVLLAESDPARLWFEAQPRLAQRVTRDVALDHRGQLYGRVIDAQGGAQPGSRVLIRKDGIVTAEYVTDEQGQFTTNRLNGGVYEVASESGSGVYRLWPSRSAPPSAAQSATVVETPVQRAQSGGGRIQGLASNPWVLGGAAIVGITLPLALGNSSEFSELDQNDAS